MPDNTITRIADVIVPELFTPYVIERTRELSRLIASGLVSQNAILSRLVTQGGRTINIPFWRELVGEDEVLSDIEPMTPSNITAGQDVATLLIRGKPWAANELAGALAGDDPMTAIGTQVAQWRNIAEQRVLLSVLAGIFGGTLRTTHVNDISGMTANTIGAYAILDTKQLLGDAAEQLSGLLMHSVTYTSLQKQNLIEYIPNARGEIDFPRFMGYSIIIDDGMPYDKETGVCQTLLYTPGAIGRGDGVPVSITPTEFARDALASVDYLVQRWAFVLHPFGVAWQNQAIAGATPSNAELANPAQWKKVVPDKHIGLAMLKHKIAA